MGKVRPNSTKRKNGQGDTKEGVLSRKKVKKKVQQKKRIEEPARTGKSWNTQSHQGQ